MHHVLGIDIGTGSTKAVAVDLNGKPFAYHQEMYSYKSPKPGVSLSAGIPMRYGPHFRKLLGGSPIKPANP